MLVGPATFLLLAKAAAGAGRFRPLDRLDDLVDVYAELLAALADAGVAWVQLDEPAYVADRTAGRDRRRCAAPTRRLGAARAAAPAVRRDLLR